MNYAARISLVFALALTLQSTWLADVRPGGATGDVLLLVAITAGLAGGAMRGAAVGFAAGMAFDLVAWTPVGLSALVYLAVGYAVGSLNEGVVRSAAWIPLAATAVASAAGIIGYVLLGQLLGQQFRVENLPRIVFVTTLINTLLSLPVLQLMRWAEKAIRPASSFGAVR